ncbi:hypothetical protein ACFO25_05845 [Paenactinomyces guangxiensis]|nr:hypothetical protein [Paenactinomyces guangxiensis]
MSKPLMDHHSKKEVCTAGDVGGKLAGFLDDCRSGRNALFCWIL